MKITENFDSPQSISRDISVVRSASSANRPSADSVAPASIKDGDEAHLSHAALLAAASSSLPEVRSEKIAVIQQALATGTYAVNASDVADKLLDHLLQR